MCKLRERFVAGKVESKQFTYVGYKICQSVDQVIVDQGDFVDSIDMNEFKIDVSRVKKPDDELSCTERTLLRRIGGKLNWIIQGTRPDLAFELTDLSTKYNKGKVCDLKKAIKVFSRVKEMGCAITYPKLGNPSNWILLLFTDAAHANLADGVSSTGAYIIFIVSGERCCPIDWSASKIKRVVRSSLAAEALSMQNGIDAAKLMKTLIEEVLHVSPPIDIVTDSKDLCEAIRSTKPVLDKGLRIDLASIIEAKAKETIRAIK